VAVFILVGVEGKMSKLDIQYIIKTSQEDDLQLVEIVFVPWSNSNFNIVEISRVFWNEDATKRYVKHYELATFSDLQQEKIKQLILKEWNRHLSLMKSELYPINDSCQLSQKTRV
jgi:hypothetical protein